MAKKYKGRGRKPHRSRNAVNRLNTWTRDENAPFAETEYPFEHAVSVGEYSEVFQRDMGPGLRTYPSTVCLSRQDSHDSTVLALLGEHFREFYPDEMPWLRKSTEQMCAAMMIYGQEEEQIEELNDTLKYFANRGFLEFDLATPGEYCYRLNVDAVRKAKNACFKPMNALEQIEHDYMLRFPDIEVQQQAFVLICERSLYKGFILLTAWHLSARNTAWMVKHVEGKLNCLSANEIFAALPRSIPNSKKRQQAFEELVKKGLLKLGHQGPLRGYRPNVIEMWEALQSLPQKLPDIEAMGGYVDAESSSSEPNE